MAQSWLLKTEPSTYSFDQLIKDGNTPWNGVRNHQARGFLQKMTPGDQAFIYHSGEDKAVVGLARVTRSAYPDPDPRKPGDWVQVDLEPTRPLKRRVALATLKSSSALQGLLLIRQSQLSVMPLSDLEAIEILRLSE